MEKVICEKSLPVESAVGGMVSAGGVSIESVGTVGIVSGLSRGNSGTVKLSTDGSTWAIAGIAKALIIKNINVSFVFK